MPSERWAELLAAGVVAAGIGLPVGLVGGLVGAAILAPKDFPPPVAVPAGPAGAALSPGLSGSAAAPDSPSPVGRGVEAPLASIPAAVTAARARLLAAHSEFLQRERAASAALDRYRPTETRPARRPTLALRKILERTRREHARARAALAAEPMPTGLAEAHAATLRMLGHAEAAYGAVLEGARTRDPEFALRREIHFARALGEHYAALAALRDVPSSPAAGSRAAVGTGPAEPAPAATTVRVVPPGF